MSYAELHCHSYFSLLDGASSPEDLVAQAVDLGLAALALTDHDSLAGAVRFWNAARAANLHPIFGAEVTLEDGCHLTLLAETQAGYGNLCQLVTAARLDQVEDANAIDAPADSWAGKVAPALPWARLEKLAVGLVALTGCRRGPVAGPLCVGDIGKAEQALLHLRDLFWPEPPFCRASTPCHAG